MTNSTMPEDATHDECGGRIYSADVQPGEFFSAQTRGDLLGTALETTQWAKIYKDVNGHSAIKTEKFLHDKILVFCGAGGTVGVHDYNEPGIVLGVISAERILKAEIEMSESRDWGCIAAFRNILAEDFDADDADIWLQMVVMGEVEFSI